jgi:uncharacterized DUF497 family protein
MAFEWDETKNALNKLKHHVDFVKAREAFFDPHRLIAEDITHSVSENRYFCIGKVEEKIITVSFTTRKNQIRIISAGYFRKGRKLYEKQNSLHP